MAARKDYAKRRRELKIIRAISIVFFILSIIMFLGAVYHLGKVDGLLTATKIFEMAGCVC